MMREPEIPADTELVTRFLTDRGAAAFEVLYERHMPYLFRVALRMLDGNQAAAEDALQEAWIRDLSRSTAKSTRALKPSPVCGKLRCLGSS